MTEHHEVYKAYAKGVKWQVIDTPRNFEALGFIPSMLSFEDHRDVIEQLDSGYSHGGGWRHFNGFEPDFTSKDTFAWTITYPGDPPYRPFAYAKLKGKTILVFPHSWVAVVNADSSFEICRMD